MQVNRDPMETLSLEQLEAYRRKPLGLTTIFLLALNLNALLWMSLGGTNTCHGQSWIKVIAGFASIHVTQQ